MLLLTLILIVAGGITATLAQSKRNRAAKEFMRDKLEQRKIGIGGQAPQFLVEQGIDSISLNPDTVMKTTVAILEKETASQTGRSS
jgi:pyruvate,water dikinase